MKKTPAITLIAILAIVVVAFAALYFTEKSDKAAQIDALTADVADKTTQIETLTADVADKVTQIETLTADAADKATQIETLTADAADKATQIETLTADAADKATQIEALTADAADKATQIEALTADAADKATQIEALTADAADKATQIETLTADVDAAALELETAKKTSEELAALTLSLQLENDDLKAQLDYAAMDEEGLLAVAEQIEEPLQGYGYALTVAKAEAAVEEEAVPVEEEPVPAEAEETEAEVPAAAQADVTVYAHPRGGYAFSYPAEMVFLSKDNVQDLVDEMLNGEFTMEGMDTSTLQQQADVLAQQDMVMVMTMNGLMNVTFGYQNMGMTLTESQFLSIYCPVLMQQYQALYPDCEVLDMGSEYESGENTFITQSLCLTADGTDLTLVILYDLNGTYLYNTVFTVADELLATDLDYVNGVVEQIAASFVYSEPAAE